MTFLVQSGSARVRTGLITGVLISAIVLVGLVNAYHVASGLAQTSDSAQGFVVGHAIANGNALLTGWHFPIDNFYFTDSIPYAAAESIAGSRPCLIAIVPAAVYALLVLLALILSVRLTQPLDRNVEPLAAAVLVLAVPARTGTWNPMLMSNMHSTTAVAALIALTILARTRTPSSGSGILAFEAGLAFLLIVATLASDPFSLVFAFGPAFAVLAIDAVRRGHPANTRFPLLLLAAAIAAGLLLPPLIAQAGGFTTENDVSFGLASAGRWWSNLVDVVFSTLTLSGANPLDVQNVSDALMFVIRCAALALMIAAVGRLVRNLLLGGEAALFDRLLSAGAVVSLVACIPSAQFGNGVRAETMWHGGPPMRFLVPAVLFVSVLACRQATDTFGRLPNSQARALFRGVLLGIAGLVLTTGIPRFSLSARRPTLDQNPATVAALWLEKQEFSQGAGEYWSANLLTAMSGNAVTVRSMVPDDGRLVPYVWVEDRAFYVKVPQFVVWQEPNQTHVTEAVVRATWPVCVIRSVAGYRIALLQTRTFPTCRSA